MWSVSFGSSAASARRRGRSSAVIRKVVEEQSQDRPLSAVKTGGKAPGARGRRTRAEQPAGVDGIRAGRGDFRRQQRASGTVCRCHQRRQDGPGQGRRSQDPGEIVRERKIVFLREKLGVANNGPVQRIVVALAGNPNSGKSSLFNLLTGAHQHVANYPGVTVEKKQGSAGTGTTRSSWSICPARTA